MSTNKLDTGNIFRAVYDPPTESLKVTVLTSPSAPSVVEISNGTSLITSTTIGPKIALDTFLINTALPLPTGASTSALQSTGNASLASIDSKLTSPIAVTGPLTDAQLRATPVPVSGTITASNTANGNTGAAVPAQATQVGGSDGTNLRAIKVSATGVVSVDGSATTQPISGSVSVSNFPATQPISGTVTANQGTTPWVENVSQFGGSAVVTGTGASGAGIPRVTVSNDSNILATQSGTWNINNISGTVSLPTGASTSANQTNGSQKTQIVDGSGTVQGPAQTITGTNYMPVVLAASATSGAALVARSIQVAGSDGTNAQTLSTDATGKLNINNISGTVSLPTGAATEASLAKLTLTQGSMTSGQSGTLMQGAVTTTAPTYTTGQTDPLSLTTAGALRVDGSGSTQPVSGTVAATQSGTWTVQPGNTANTTPWLATINQGGNSATVSAGGALKVDGSAVTQPVSGTVTANIGTTGGITVAQGSTTAGESGPLIQGAVTTASPAYTTAQTSPLSLTTAGALRTDSSATTQPVSPATPTAKTVTQAAVAVGTTAVRATVTGSAPAATRVQLIVNPDVNSSALFYVGSSSVTSSGANRGVQLRGGQTFIANLDAGDYYIISDTAAQTVYILEQS